MATPFTLMRLTVSCMLAAAMLAACGGSQMSGSSVGTTPQAAGAPNSQHSILPADDGGGGCGGDTQGGIRPNDDGHGCGGGCGGGSWRGGLSPNDGGGCCGSGDGGSSKGGNGVRRNDDGGGHCHSISVTPHVIYFTPSSSGPVIVTVKTQEQGTVSEIDDCGGASGVATVTQNTGTGNTWTVTAGAQQGSCKALYLLKNSSGQKIGHAVLHITNFL